MWSLTLVATLITASAAINTNESGANQFSLVLDAIVLLLFTYKLYFAFAIAILLLLLFSLRRFKRELKFAIFSVLPRLWPSAMSNSALGNLVLPSVFLPFSVFAMILGIQFGIVDPYQHYVLKDKAISLELIRNEDVFDRRTGIGATTIYLDSSKKPFNFIFTMTPMGNYTPPNSLTEMALTVRRGYDVVLKNIVAFSTGKDKIRRGQHYQSFETVLRKLDFGATGEYTIEIQRTAIEDLPVREVKLSVFATSPGPSTKAIVFGLIAFVLGLLGILANLKVRLGSKTGHKPQPLRPKKWGRGISDQQ